METANIHSNGFKKCAFCKNWYDPTNSALVLYAPHIGRWKFDERAKSKCMMTNAEKYAYQSCAKYELKLI